MHAQAARIMRLPEVLKAWKVLDRSRSGKNEDKAREQYNLAKKPAEELSEALVRERNQFLLGQLNQFAESGVLLHNTEESKLFSAYVNRIELGSYDMGELPEEYHYLVNLASNPQLTEHQKGTILWHMYEKFKFVGEKGRRLLVPVILDMYQITLGPVDSVCMPTSETRHMLAAATSIVHEHGHSMFKSASQEQLQTLGMYSMGVRQHAERVASGALIEEEVQAKSIDADDVGWQKSTMRNLEEVMEEMASVAENYERYLTVEAAKVYPHLYYPLILQRLAPFWQKMQWEMGPGQRPSGEISALYRVLDSYIKNRLVIKDPEEYTEDFDVMEEGRIDGLLKECYERMVVPHDIKYNGTVWREGLSFVNNAITLMPPVLLERIKAKYPNSGFADYLEREHARWNKEEDIQ
jgi:hypothetical protein